MTSKKWPMQVMQCPVGAILTLSGSYPDTFAVFVDTSGSREIRELDALVETSRGMTVVVRMKSEGQDTWCLRVATDMVCLSLGDTARGRPRC